MDDLNHLSLLPVLLDGICGCLASHGFPDSRSFARNLAKNSKITGASRTLPLDPVHPHALLCPRPKRSAGRAGGP